MAEQASATGISDSSRFHHFQRLTDAYSMLLAQWFLNIKQHDVMIKSNKWWGNINLEEINNENVSSKKFGSFDCHVCYLYDYKDILVGIVHNKRFWRIKKWIVLDKVQGSGGGFSMRGEKGCFIKEAAVSLTSLTDEERKWVIDQLLR